MDELSAERPSLEIAICERSEWPVTGTRLQHQQRWAEVGYGPVVIAALANSSCTRSVALGLNSDHRYEGPAGLLSTRAYRQTGLTIDCPDRHCIKPGRQERGERF